MRVLLSTLGTSFHENMQKGDQHRWIWLVLLLSYKFLMVKGGECYCRIYRDCIENGVPADPNRRKPNIRRVNVALGKPSNQSSFFTGTPNSLCANDGSRIADSDTRCIMTNLFDPNPYYMIDLGREYQISSFTVHWKRGTIIRNKHVRFLVDQSLCFAMDSEQQVMFPNEIVCTNFLRGRYVKAEKRSQDLNYLSPLDRVLHICELEVWVCWPGFYGRDCSSLCKSPVCADRRPCDPWNGYCATPRLEVNFGAQGPLSTKVVIKATRPPTTAGPIVINVPTAPPTTTTTTTPPPPEECLNWVYAVCIIVACILITVGIYVSLTSSQKEDDEIEDQSEALMQPMDEGESRV